MSLAAHTGAETRRRPCLVVVEDHPELRGLLVEALECEGYAVIAHDRAQGAKELIRRTRPAAVLLDLRLGPDLPGQESGWQVLDQLALDPSTRGIPVIVQSGANDSIEAHRPALCPPHLLRVLAKPYDLEQLLGALDALCGERRQSLAEADDASV